MAGTNQQQSPGDGVARPVIPLQNTEELPAIEIIDEDAGSDNTRTDPKQPTEGGQAGQYEYDAEGGTEGQGSDARLSNFQRNQQPVATVEQPQPGETQEQMTARQRRRQREKDARNRERAELVRLRAENARLAQGHQQLDARVANVEKAGIDGQIAAIEVEIQRAQTVMARAVESQNGDDMAQALEIRDQFRDRLAQLKAQKKAGGVVELPSQEQVQAPQDVRLPNGLTQAQVHYARIFSGRHQWFNANQSVRDRDSDMVRQIDGEMLAEGLNPSQPEYWVELERRVQEDMPHKFQEPANEGGQQPNGGQQPARQQTNNGRGNGPAGRASGGPKLPGGGSGGSGAGNGSVKFHLSKARKDAMIASGAWEDPAAKERQIRYYMKWDNENPSS